jgi:hypothetical protein
MQTQARPAPFVRFTRLTLLRVVLVVALFGVAAGCGGAPVAPPEPIDMDRELDLLFVCAQTTLVDAGYEIAGRNEATRMMSTDWHGDEERRHRAFVTVVLHPSYGPGVIARLAEQIRDPEESEESVGVDARPDPESGPAASQDPGWLNQPADQEARDWQDRYLAEVQDCWRESR